LAYGLKYNVSQRKAIAIELIGNQKKEHDIKQAT
jgi:hypothetical protein